MSGSVSEKTTNDKRSNEKVAAPVTVSQNWTSSELFASFVVPAIVLPSDEKEREWRDDPMNQLDFFSMKTYLKEFIMFEEDSSEDLRMQCNPMGRKLRYILHL